MAGRRVQAMTAVRDNGSSSGAAGRCKRGMITLELFHGEKSEICHCYFDCLRICGFALDCVRLLSGCLEESVQRCAAGSLFRPYMQNGHCQVHDPRARTPALLHRFRFLIILMARSTRRLPRSGGRRDDAQCSDGGFIVTLDRTQYPGTAAVRGEVK
jgi:hypothetical protein